MKNSIRLDLGEYIKQSKDALVNLFDINTKYKDQIENFDWVGSSPPIRSSSEEELREKSIALAKTEAYQEHKKKLDDLTSVRFSRAIIAGSILQVAFKAIELFSKNEKIPSFLEADFKPKYPKDKKGDINSEYKFAIGRTILDIPIGYVIYAGRSQYNHIEDKDDLRKFNTKIFRKMHECLDRNSSSPNFTYNLNAEFIDCYSFQFLDSLDWECFEDFSGDLKSMLA